MHLHPSLRSDLCSCCGELPRHSAADEALDFESGGQSRERSARHLIPSSKQSRTPLRRGEGLGLAALFLLDLLLKELSRSEYGISAAERRGDKTRG